MLRRFNRNVRLYLLSGALIGFTAAGGIYGVLLNLYLLRLGYGLELVGPVAAAGALSYAVFCLPAGALGRRWGSRRMMVLGMILIVLGNGVLPLAEFLPSPWQWKWLLATRALRALGFAFYMVNASPFLMSATGSEERTHVFSVQAALWPLSGFAGSLVGGFLPGLFASFLGVSLDGPEAYRYTLFVATVLLSPAVLVLLATREVGVEHRQEKVSQAGPVPLGPIVFMALVMLLQTAGMGAVQTYFNVYLDQGLEVSTALIGSLVAAGQLVGGIAALATPLVAVRWGYIRIVVWGSLGTALSLLPLVLVPHWGAAGLSFVGISALTTIRFAAIAVYQQEMVSTRWRTFMSGATNTASGLSFSFVSLGGAYMIPLLGYGNFFSMGAGLMAAGALVFWAYFRVPRGEYARQAADTAK